MKKLILAAAVLALAGMNLQNANAGLAVRFVGVFPLPPIPVPVVTVRAPEYCAPAPVYCPPPAPAYCPPAPCAPPVVYYQPGWGHYGPRMVAARDWRQDRRDDRRDNWRHDRDDRNYRNGSGYRR